jgi:hypothetical protein
MSSQCVLVQGIRVFSAQLWGARGVCEDALRLAGLGSHEADAVRVAAPEANCVLQALGLITSTLL